MIRKQEIENRRGMVDKDNVEDDWDGRLCDWMNQITQRNNEVKKRR